MVNTFLLVIPILRQAIFYQASKYALRLCGCAMDINRELLCSEAPLMEQSVQADHFSDGEFAVLCPLSLEDE